MTPSPPTKKDVAVALLQSSVSVFVHLDPRRERVSVPSQFTKQPHLILEVGLNMPVPIRDLDVTDEGITCTLSFSRTPYWCRMPWSSIFAVVGHDQRGMVWPEDVPSDSQFNFSRTPEAVKPVAKRPHLRAVTDQGSDSEAPVKPKRAPKKSEKPVTPLAAVPSMPVSVDSVGDDDAVPKAPVKSVPVPQKGKARKLPPYLRVVK